MKKLILVTVFYFLFAFGLKAENNCSCEDFKNRKQNELINTLEKSELEFASTFETANVRGLQGASYYYCDNNHGFLLIRLHDEEFLYKEVPLNVWFELKFSDSVEFYYKDQIKYNFISV